MAISALLVYLLFYFCWFISACFPKSVGCSEYPSTVFQSPISSRCQAVSVVSSVFLNSLLFTNGLKILMYSQLNLSFFPLPSFGDLHFLCLFFNTNSLFLEGSLWIQGENKRLVETSKWEPHASPRRSSRGFAAIFKVLSVMNLSKILTCAFTGWIQGTPIQGSKLRLPGYLSGKGFHSGDDSGLITTAATRVRTQFAGECGACLFFFFLILT